MRACSLAKSTSPPRLRTLWVGKISNKPALVEVERMHTGRMGGHCMQKAFLERVGTCCHGCRKIVSFLLQVGDQIKVDYRGSELSFARTQYVLRALFAPCS
jgi:hypothetical protein